MAIDLPADVRDFLDKQMERHVRENLNIYVCKDCRGHIITKDRDVGVTPFMIGCKATAGCKGMMKSSMYRVFDQKMKPTFEWFRPDSLDGLSSWETGHVQQGGLLLREIQ